MHASLVVVGTTRLLQQHVALLLEPPDVGDELRRHVVPSVGLVGGRSQVVVVVVDVANVSHGVGVVRRGGRRRAVGLLLRKITSRSVE